MINNYLERQIKENFPYQPTPEQEIAVKSLSEFLLSPRSEVVFMLRGYAGTGKTSLVGALVRTLDKLQQKSVLLAPTGRAAKVFSAYAGHPAFTIHKKIYRQQSFSNELSNFSVNDNLTTHTLYIVDEASMISNEGLSGEDPIPVLEGTITVHSKYYQDTVDALRNVFTRLELILDGVACIKFADPEVKRICVKNWDDDGNGEINVSEAGVSRILFRIFADNEKIETFDELKYFNITPQFDNNFTNCSRLRSISLPKTYTIIKYQDFKGTSLEHIELPDTLTVINGQAFYEVSTLKDVSIPDSVLTIANSAFSGTGISRFVYPPDIATVDGLGRNPNLTYVEVGEKATTITGMGSCPLLETLIIRAVTPPATNYWTLLNAPRIPNIYVPDTAVSAYKTASGWSKWAAYIRPISEMVEN